MQSPKVAVLSVCAHQGRVLLVQRRNPPDAGLWGFPGGHVNWGESLKAAAAREAFEETALRVEAGEVLDHVEVITHQDDAVTHHFLLVALACRYLSGEVQAGDDAVAARWASLADIDDLPCSEYVEEIAQMALARTQNWPTFPREPDDAPPAWQHLNSPPREVWERGSPQYEAQAKRLARLLTRLGFAEVWFAGAGSQDGEFIAAGPIQADCALLIHLENPDEAEWIAAMDDDAFVIAIRERKELSCRI